MPQSGVISLGQSVLDPRPMRRDKASVVIQNTDGDSWITLENRFSMPLMVTIPQTDLQAAAPSAIGLGGMSVPALSLAMLPISPDRPVIVSLARADQLSWTTNQQNVAQTTPTFYLQQRSVPYQLTEGGSFGIMELYPLRDCVILTKSATLAFGTSVVYDVVGGQGTNINLLTAGSVPAGDLWKGVSPPTDAVIMALQAAITILGASSTSDQLICSVNVMPGVQSGNAQSDVNLFGSSAAAANISASSALTPLYGVQEVQWTNVGGVSSITFRSSYWVAYPHDPPQI